MRGMSAGTAVRLFSFCSVEFRCAPRLLAGEALEVDIAFPVAEAPDMLYQLID